MFIPVLITTPIPVPVHTKVDENKILFKATISKSSYKMDSTYLFLGSVSPVNADWSTLIIAVLSSNNLISAGTFSPAETSTISPGTNSSLSIFNHLDSLNTLQDVVYNDYNASRAFSAS